MLDVNADAELARPFSPLQLPGYVSGLFRGVGENRDFLDVVHINIILASLIPLTFEDLYEGGEGRPGRNIFRPVVRRTGVRRPPPGSVPKPPSYTVVVRIFGTGNSVGRSLKSRDLRLDPFLDRQSTSPRFRPHSSQALAAALWLLAAAAGFSLVIAANA